MFPDVGCLDERYRWCVYCAADCWPDPEYQRHDSGCALVTGVYPAEPDPFEPGSYGGCTVCATTFTDTDATGRVDQPRPDVGWVVCLGCAALGRDPREEP